MKVLVIIPAFNEEENILDACEKIKNLKIKNVKIDYVVINDASCDETKDICINNNLNFIDLSCNLGIGGAVQTGYKYAFNNRYDIAIQFDGDGQHDESYIKDLILNINSGYDMVIGSRYICELNEFKSTFMRRLGSKILCFLIKLFTNQYFTDPTSGFRACNSKIIENFASDYPIDYPEPETLASVAKKGLLIKEVPVKMKRRIGGISSINFLKSIYYMLKVSIAIFVVGLSTKGVGK